MSEATRIPDSADAGIGFKGWWMVFVLFGCHVFAMLDRLILTLLVDPIKADLHLNDFQMGLIMGPAFAVFFALFAFPLGWASDRYPRRWVIYCCVTIWAFATMASGLARSFATLFIARCVVGAGEAGLSPAAHSLLHDLFPEKRLTTALAVYQSAGKMGSAVAFGVGALAISFAYGLEDVAWPLLGELRAWQMVLIMIGAPGMIFALLLFTITEPARDANLLRIASSESEKAARKGVFLSFMRDNMGLVFLIMAGFSAMSVAGFSLTTWVPTYIQRHFQVGPSVFGPLLAATNVVAAFSLIANGYFVDYLSGRGVKNVHLRFYRWLIVIMIPITFVMFNLQSVILFCILFTMVQFSTVPFMMYVSAILSKIAPSAAKARLLALYIIAFNIIGHGLGPTIVGAINDYVFGDEMMIGTSLLIVVLVAMLVAILCISVAMPRTHAAIERAQVSSGTQH